jgi:glycosyltransferase involved in cell wall biosynthesis
MAPKPRIALVLQGDPTSDGAWSGVPAGLGAGLQAEGCEVVPINAEFPRAGRIAGLLGKSWADQATSRAFAAANTRVASRALRAAAPLDGAVLIGSGFSISSDAAFVTFEDMTVAQALRQDEPVYRALGDAAAARWRARQLRNYEHSIGCCVASEWAAESVRQDYGIDASKVHVVGFGSNLEPLSIDRDWHVPRFLFVGVDWERKRGAAVVEAFAAVRERHPEATLDLVGGHPRIAMEGVVEHGFLPLGSEEGRRRYAELLGSATCLLMPSTFEPFGIAYLDAAASCVPSIGTTVGGAADAVGESGRLVSPDDPPALVEAMMELADAETARNLGERGLSRSARFTWQAVAERVLSVLLPARVARVG